MNQSITLAQIADFFERLDQIKQAEAGQFISHFNEFKAGFAEAKNADEYAIRQFAPRFNIFQLLGVQYSELHHSRFIAYLLDPKKDHAQGSLFLQTFFQVLQKNHPDPEISLPDAFWIDKNWLIKPEYDIGVGRLDIILRNRSLKILYVIENKVYAPEQTDQVARYVTYLDDQQENYKYRGLLFLTPGGHDSETSGGKTYCRISYQYDIREWLEYTLTLPELQAANVRETVKRYLATVQKL